MPSDDLKNYATSSTDFYELLGITFENSQKDLDRAWRKTALKYHPDKVGNDPVAKERFHLAQIGYDLLSDPTAKALYDTTRAARLQKKRQNELFEGKRRQMKDDLEAREKGVKRARTEEEANEEELERQLRRLAEDGKRRRKEREELLRKELRNETQKGAEPTEINTGSSTAADSLTSSNTTPSLQSDVSELERTVLVRWSREGQGESVGQDQILTLFSAFGKIETVRLLDPKRLRMGIRQKKQLASRCMVQYCSVIGAHAAVEDFHKQKGPKWEVFDSVNWVANKEPDFINGYQSGGSEAGSAASTPARNGTRASHTDFLGIGSQFSTPLSQSKEQGDGLRKMPSFSSFSASALSTPRASLFGKTSGVKTPSLEEMTMIRLKNAEKKRLAEEIQRQDEEAATNEANNP